MSNFQASLAVSSFPIHRWRQQLCIHHPDCRDSFLSLFLSPSANKILGRHDMTAYDCAHLRPEESHSTHQCAAGTRQGTMAGRNLLRAGGKVTTGKQRAKWLLLLLAPALFILPDPDTSHHKRVQQPLKQTLTPVIFIYIFLNNASARFIFHSKSQDCQELAGPLIKEPKVSLVLHRKYSLVLKAEANPTQISLFKPSFKNWLATKFHWLTAWEPSRVFQQLLLPSRITAYLSSTH